MHHAPVHPNPDTASFLSGMSMRLVIGIPWSEENATWFAQIGAGADFQLQMNADRQPPASAGWKVRAFLRIICTLEIASGKGRWLMTIDRSGRIVVASGLFVVAMLLVSNYAVNGAALADYVLPLLLAALGVVFIFFDRPVVRRAAAPAAPAAQEPAPVAKAVREFLPAGTPAAGAVSEAATEAAPHDDLTVLDGIGPRIAAALQEAGIHTYDQLADQTTEALHNILSGARVRIVGTVERSLPTWPRQAQYAAAGDFDGLARYVATHKQASAG